MNRSRRRALQAAALLPCWLAAPAATRAAAVDKFPTVLGYLPWWMAPGWSSTLLEGFDRIVLFDAPITGDGALEQRAWQELAPGLDAYAQAHGIGLELALTLLTEADFERVFAHKTVWQRLLGECAQCLEAPFLGGLHLDIEGYGTASPPAIAGFRAWLGALYERAAKMGKTLSGFFPASDAFIAYDAAAVRRIAWWVVQLYDAHWAESLVTGPLVTRRDSNPVGVPRALARLAALGVARERMLLSVPLYGWQWPSASDRPGSRALGKARLLTFGETSPALMPNDRLAATQLAALHGLRRDGERTPYYAYQDSGRWMQGWYEDMDSLKHKLAQERQGGYAGLAFFPLGYDQGSLVAPLLRWWRSPPS